MKATGMVLCRTVMTAAVAAAFLILRPALASASCQVVGVVKAANDSVLPGEPIELTFTIRNATAQPVSLFKPSELTGNVRLSIANSSGPDVRRDYRGPGWGIRDAVGAPVLLSPNGELTIPLRILYHSVVLSVNPDRTKEIMTAFAISQPGTFLLKPRYSDHTACPRSAPAEAVATVQVVAPTGKDLAVWNAIKECKQCAYFLHTGREQDNQASHDAVTLLRNLVKQYPSSRYAKLIRSQLDALDSKSRGDHNDDGHPDQGKPPASN